jgi:hypothetical protein
MNSCWIWGDAGALRWLVMGRYVYVSTVLEMIPRTVGGEAIHREVDGFDEPGDFCKTVYTYYN